MEFFTPFRPESSSSLGLALVVSSSTPLILLNEQLVVQAASGSFCRAFSVDPASVVGTELFAMGNGEWNIPQLRSLLTAIASGSAPAGADRLVLNWRRPPRNAKRHYKSCDFRSSASPAANARSSCARCWSSATLSVFRRFAA